MKATLYISLLLVLSGSLADSQSVVSPFIAIIKKSGEKIIINEKQLDELKNELDPGDEDGVLYELLTIRQSNNATSDDEAGVLSTKQLLYHAEMLSALAQTQVEMFGVNWTLGDFCFKLQQHKPEGRLAATFFSLLWRIYPCTVVSPLDCFLEGAFVQGPYPPLNLRTIAKLMGFKVSGGGELDWTNYDPRAFLGLIKDVAKGLDDKSIHASIKTMTTLFETLGVQHGYTKKFCLDPENPRCPVTAPNHNNITAEFDVDSILGSGCKGVIENFQKWNPKFFLDEFTQNSPGGPITSAQHIMSTILLANASDIFTTFANDPKAKHGLNESAWAEQGVAGVAALLSEWTDRSFEIMANVALRFGIDPTQFDIDGIEEWIDSSEVYENTAKSGLEFAATLDDLLKKFGKD